MAAFVAGLLGMSQQELRFRVQRANDLTVAPFLSLFPILGLTASSDVLLLVAAADVAFPLPTSSQPAQLLEDADGEQNHAQSDASALEPLSLNSDAKSQEGELQLTLCEQGLCGRWEALPHRGERERESLSVCSEEGLAGLGEALPQVEEEGDQLMGGEIAELSHARGVASIAQLDGGCLAKVLSYADNKTLRACSLVCREWLEVSSFARTLMSLQEGPQITALPSLMARFSRLETLHIQGPEILPAWMLARLNELASEPPITEQAAMVPLDDSMLEIIARGCRSLNKLDLEWCSDISDAGLAVVLRGCSGLTDLSVEGCVKITGATFGGLVLKLEKLDLASCDALTNEGLLAAVTACPGLRSLSVSSNLQDQSLANGLEEAARTRSELQTLGIHGCGVTDATLRSIAASCPSLRHVAISCERAVTDGGLAGFLPVLPELESLTLQNLQGVSGIPRVGTYKRLKTLCLGYWWDMPDLVLREVSKETTLEKLRFLCMPQLTDATICSVFAGCTNLKLLELFDTELITAETVRAYLRNGRKCRLQIRDCPGASRENLPEELRGVQQEVFP